MRAALGVIRLSGPAVPQIRDQVLRCHGPGPWRAGHVRRVDARDDSGTFDDGMAVFHAGPRSYTGEHTLEVTLHGNPLILERFIGACRAAGARLARPGEFTRRATLAGKLDLLAAEAIDLTIRAQTPAGLALARRTDRLGEVLTGIRTELLDAMAELEARLDHPSDEVSPATDQALMETIRSLGVRCADLAAGHRTGRHVIDGARVAIVGPVNAGKSSLFNALLGRERALVHDRAGTTRDVVESRMRLGPLEITLLDTAGERETDDPIEAAGLALAGEMTATADLWVVVAPGRVDTTVETILERAGDRSVLCVCNRMDLADAVAPRGWIGTSTKTGRGLPELKTALLASLAEHPVDQVLVGSLRQADGLRAVAEACDATPEAFAVAGVAAAADTLMEGLEALDGITGADSREEVLDALFSRFCIGK